MAATRTIPGPSGQNRGPGPITGLEFGQFQWSCRLRRVFRFLAILIVIVGAGTVAFSYFYGSLRVQREANAFNEALLDCTPFAQQAWAPMLRGTMAREIVGTEGDACVMTMQALGAGQLRCRLDADGKALMLRFVQDGADTTGFLGGQSVSLRYSSENPDPMTELMNGPACTTEP